MDITTFMIAVFCLIEDFLAGRQLRARGPQPTLRDSEVLTIEVVGEFLSIDTESNIFTHFRRYYADWFPGIRQITRTTFTRQAANLWKVKQELWQVVAHAIPQDPYISIVDSFPGLSVVLPEHHAVVPLEKRLPLVMMKWLAKRIMVYVLMSAWPGQGF